MTTDLPDEASTAAVLAGTDPDLADRYTRQLPAARGTVLARLWGALVREPVPGVLGSHRDGTDQVVDLADGRTLRGPAALAEPFATAPAGWALQLGGEPVHHPAELLRALRLPGDTARLAAEVANSVANLAMARAANAPNPAGRPEPDPDAADVGACADPAVRLAAQLADVEQAVVDGHPLHPCCRTRGGLDTAAVLAYAPEHHPTLQLPVVAVPADRWRSTGAGLPPLLPLHPAQLPWALQTGLVTDTGRRIPARPLMSLRTMAPVDGGDHLKTALHVQMTSAVRIVSPAAVHNGPLLSTLLATAGADLPELLVLAEPAGGGVRCDGDTHPGLAVLHRTAPPPVPGAQVLPLAALTAVTGHDGRPLGLTLVDAGYRGSAEAFVAALAGLLLPATLTLLHRGVALEAHGQNTLGYVRDGRLLRLAYRDLGGVRISPARLAAAGLEAPPLRGDLVTDDPGTLRTKLQATAVATVLADVVTMLGRHRGCPPGPLWDRVAAVARDTYRRLPTTAGGDARAMFAEEMPMKALTAMRLADDPLTDRWARVANPLAGLG